MNRTALNQLPPRTVLLVILLLGLSLRLWAFTGIFGADDVAIANVAKDLLEHGFSVPEGHYAQRLGLVFPLALIFKLFGTGDWQFAVLPMAASMGAIVLAYATGRLIISQQTGLIAAWLLAIFPLDIFNASMLFPDAIMGTCLALAYYLALRAENATHPWLPAFVAGLLIGLGWLVKVEAPILLPVLAVYWFLNPARRWQIVLFAGTGALLVLGAEGAIYYLLANDPLRGIHAAINQGGGVLNVEYSATQLWIFPKAWFVTAYDFGLHYYLLFAAMVWVILNKRKECYVLLAWVLMMLLWLEFGGNPFAAHYSVKSHLARYCLTITVPSVILISGMISHLWDSGRFRIATFLVGTATATGLFLMVFNALGSDGIKATKLGLDYAVAHNTFPLYLDKKSYDIAPWYLGNKIKPTDIHPVQQHDFQTQTTHLLHAEEINGWVLDNREFADFAQKRYGIKPVADMLSGSRFVVEKSIDNPGSDLAYAQARLLHGIIGLMPESYLTSKALKTLDTLLEGNQVKIYRTPDARQ
jgi:hypothetical protein